MGFAVSSYDMPRVYSYSDAVTLFTNLTPIRGGDQNVKRFVKRTDKAKLLKLEYDNDVEVYAFYYYNTPVVKYYPTHLEIYMGGWSSESTRNVIMGLTGFDVNTVRLSDYIPAGFRDGRHDIGAELTFNGYPIHTNDIYKFGYDGKPVEGQELPNIKKYSVNRSRMMAVRKVYKPFIQYVKVMTPMIDIENDNIAGELFEEASRIDAKGSHGIHWIIDNASKEENHWKAFLVMVAEWHDIKWEYSPNSGYKQRRILNANKMLRAFENALKQANPQVLDVTVVS